MKNYLVIGNPIEHSLSPKLHNYWIKINNIKASYEKKNLNKDDLESFINLIKEGKISGANITVPFKKEIIQYLDKLSPEAEKTQSVNTVYKNNNEIIGANTDIFGFESAINELNFKVYGKKILILGAGGVVSSIILALYRMKVSEVIVSNRTYEKAKDLKKLFKDLKIVKWGDVPYFDVIINATSLGLKKNDEIQLDLSKVEKGKLFYDIIYSPNETNFLKRAKNLGNVTENGKKMFIYQASEAFKIWHKIQPNINKNVIKLLEK